MGEQVTIEHLFHKSWFRPFGLSTLLLILYAPIGVCLVIVRLFMAIQFFLLACILPPSKIRQKCMRIMSCVLGMTVCSDGDMQPGGKVFVSNHISELDHLAIHLSTNAFTPTKRQIPGIISDSLAMVEIDGDNLTRDDIDSSEEPWLLFPEGEATNGVAGLLSFSAVELPEGLVVQPVALQVSRYFFNPSSLSGSLTQQILISLFVPNTHFAMRFLQPEIVDAEGLWKQKSQAAIAQALNLTTTKFDESDKAEWKKRVFFRPPSLATQARAVQQQLSPHILSTETIIAALQRTGSVEAAVETLRQTCVGSSCGVPPSTFSKNAAQRMMSFQERKRIMVANARQKYIEKHGLNIAG